jgi:hypothetical protein
MRTTADHHAEAGAARDHGAARPRTDNRIGIGVDAAGSDLVERLMSVSLCLDRAGAVMSSG